MRPEHEKELLRSLYAGFFAGRLTPLVEWAEQHGIARDEVVALIRRLRDEGVADVVRAGGQAELKPAGVLLCEAEGLPPVEVRAENEEIRFSLMDALDRSPRLAMSLQVARIEVLAACVQLDQHNVNRHLEVLRHLGYIKTFQIGDLQITEIGRRWIKDMRERRSWTDAGVAESLSARAIKFALLRVLANEPPRPQGRHNIIGGPNRQGDLERSEKRVLDANERALAGRALRELEAAGLVRPTYSSIGDPEDWLEITEAGRRALERRALDVLDEALVAVSPHLVDLRDGAWSAIASGGVDSLRQGAHSGRELLDQLLRSLAPDDEVKAESWFEPDPGVRGGVTRRHRWRLAIKKRGLETDDLRSLESLTELLLSCANKLAGLAHTRSESDKQEVVDGITATEIALRRLLLRGG